MAFFGVEILARVEFNSELSKWTAENFFYRFFREIFNVERLVVGPDFAFGHKREGSIVRLGELGKKYGIVVETVPSVVLEGIRVSSSEIRRLLRHAHIGQNLELANQMLTESYRISGAVVAGEQRGRKLGFPTANLQCDVSPLVPKGVYASQLVWKGQKFSSITNIGINPTFDGDENRLKIETHAFDFNMNLYGEEISVELVRFIRAEKKFVNAHELMQQIQQDLQQAKIQ